MANKLTSTATGVDSERSSVVPFTLQPDCRQEGARTSGETLAPHDSICCRELGILMLSSEPKLFLQLSRSRVEIFLKLVA